jgi:transcriptional regulator with XRE-family HTH domain
MALSDQVKSARERMSFTQVQLAKLAGVSQTTISEIEKGKTQDIGAKVLFQLAEALNVDARELIEEKSDTAALRLPFHEEEAVLNLYRKLAPENQRILRAVAQAMIDFTPSKK